MHVISFKRRTLSRVARIHSGQKNWWFIQVNNSNSVFELFRVFSNIFPNFAFCGLNKISFLRFLGFWRISSFYGFCWISCFCDFFSELTVFAVLRINRVFVVFRKNRVFTIFSEFRVFAIFRNIIFLRGFSNFAFLWFFRSQLSRVSGF